ncbi:MAG: LacI family DNA-binding transcriptional regulator [Gaiellales bacterium]
MTSNDVARSLGLSQSTVSRALRGDPRVAPPTLARVLAAAQQMRYAPNLAARSLITRRTRTIGVVVSDITNPFYPELLDILHNEFALASYRTILLNERTDAELEPHVADLVNGQAVDGLVYVSAVLGVPLPGRGPGGLPIVLLNREADAPGSDTVVSDNRAGGRLIAETLVARGHRRIALIAGPENTSTSRERELGFRERLAALGVPLDEQLRRSGQYSHQSGYRSCLDLLASDPRPTAVFAGNDVVAFGALDAARHLSVRVPGDLSVVGFDDIDMAGWEGFDLATVRQPLAGMARAAAILLMERIAAERDAPPRRRVFPVELVERGTLGAAPGAPIRIARRKGNG